MKVPHHGSADPGLPAVLRRLRPRSPRSRSAVATATAIPVRRRSRRSVERVAHVYRTDRDGTVTLDVEGDRMNVSTER